MAVVTITTIKNWFKTGLKPTQAQFWDTWDSFWHKHEQIPVDNIIGLQPLYDAVNGVKFFQFQELSIYKAPQNNNPANKYTLEIGDIAAGWINENYFMPFGIYLGGDVTLLESWDTSPYTFE